MMIDSIVVVVVVVVAAAAAAFGLCFTLPSPC